ncbi:MAG: C40 family peptidase [Bacilli bacterium]
MKRIPTTIVSLTVAVVMIGSLATTTHASSLSQKKQVMSQLQAEVNQTNQSMTFAKTQVVTLQQKIAQYQRSLNNIKGALSANLTQTQQTEKQLWRLDTGIRIEQRRLAQDKRSLRSQLRVMYENGRVSYVSVLLQSTNWEDFLSRLYMLITIAKADHQLETRVMSLKQSLVTQHRAKLTTYDRLVNQHSEFVVLQQADQLMAAQKQQMLNQVTQSIQADTVKHGVLESQIQLTESQIKQIEQETAQAQSLVQNTTYIAQTEKNLQTVNIQSLLNYAESYMGTPYVWGGTSPSGFDCSGFTQYVFAHFGVNLYRTSEEQFAQGLSVPESQLALGDLVFFSTYAPGASHEGIYIGNNLMVDAQDFGVSIDNITNSYWGPKYLGARQVVHG